MSANRPGDIFAVWECFDQGRHIVSKLLRTPEGVRFRTLCGRTFATTAPDHPGGYCPECSAVKSRAERANERRQNR